MPGFISRDKISTKCILSNTNEVVTLKLNSKTIIKILLIKKVANIKVYYTLCWFYHITLKFKCIDYYLSALKGI